MKTFFFVLFFCMGVAVGVAALGGIYLAHVSMQWPATEGKIVDSNVGASSGSGPATYSPKVRYTYTVDGRTYEGNRIYFAGIRMASSHDYARKLAGRFLPGRAVNVYFDPDNVERSVLLPGVRTEHWLNFLVSGAFIAFALLGMYMDRRYAMKRKVNDLRTRDKTASGSG